MTLYILAYNNYYNRILKREETVSDYQPYILHTLQNTNFNPADGINTQHVFGSNANAYEGKGDYLIAVEDGEIISRWFILEANRSRAGQWTLDLYRDLIADYYDTLQFTPMFIEKGLLPNSADPAIFNKEDMTFNQIKTREYLVKDTTLCKWIALYLDKNFSNTSETLSFANTNELNVDITGDSGHPIYSYLMGGNDYIYTNPHNKKIRYIFNGRTLAARRGSKFGYAEFYIDADTNNISNFYLDTPRSIYDIADLEGYVLGRLKDNFPSIFNSNKGAISTNLMTNYSSYLIDEDYISEYDGKIFYNNIEGKSYKISVNYRGTQTKGVDIIKGGPGWTEYVNTAQAYVNYCGEGSINEDCQYASTNVTFDAYQIQLTPMESNFTVTTTIPELRTRTIDASYDLVVMPYLETAIPTQDSSSIDGQISMFIAQQMAQRYGSGSDKHIYDIQLLPFCPIPTVVDNSGGYYGFSMGKGLTEDKDFVYIRDAEKNIISIMYFVANCKVSFRNFLRPYFSTDFEDPHTSTSGLAIDRKINLVTKKFRLSSGDYSSSFEFNPFMVRPYGITNQLTLDIAYKPYSPYIRLAPEFAGLYGDEFNDGRGLICTGDFSISSITDPFETYKLQNVNYQKAFDRQIENLEVQQKVARTQDIVGAISGTFTGAAGGAIAGSTGGAAGAIAGAVVGAGASLAGGIADVALNDKLRNEAIDYAQDQFGYQMGNIKALPNTLNKVDSFNPNNKIWPVVEYYTCTDIERQAFIDKLKYNGCTIMRIGFMQNFTGVAKAFADGKYDFGEYGYFKAKLIRLEDLGEDYHVLNQLSAELNKGIFI